MPPNQYAQAAIEALGKLSPEDRAAFMKMLQERAAARGVALPRQLASEPKELGHARGHRGHGGQACHAGFVPNRVAPAVKPTRVEHRAPMAA